MAAGCRSMEPQIRQMIAMCTGGEPGWKITTTGHSLGGGIATLCAYDIQTSSYALPAFRTSACAPTAASLRCTLHLFVLEANCS